MPYTLLLLGSFIYPVLSLKDTHTFFVLRLIMRIGFNSQSSDTVSFGSKRLTTSTEIDKWMDNSRTHFQRPNLVKGCPLSLSLCFVFNFFFLASKYCKFVLSFSCLVQVKRQKIK